MAPRTDAENDERFVSADYFKRHLEQFDAFVVENGAQHKEVLGVVMDLKSDIDKVKGGITALKWIGGVALSIATLAVGVAGVWAKLHGG